MGNFGPRHTTPPIELFAATLDVTAQGDINVGTIINPTIARPVGPPPLITSHWDLEYAPNYLASASLRVTGDVSLYGDQQGALYYGPALRAVRPT